MFSMVQLKFDVLQFGINVLEEDGILMQGTFVWIINPGNKPPHLGVSQSGLYYSVKKNGLDYGKSVNQFTLMLRKKEIPCLFVRIEDANFGDAQAIFSEFDALKNGMTCLDPIKKLVKNQVAETIHDLLSDLHSNDQILSVYSLNLDNEFNGLANYNRMELLQWLDEEK